MLLVEWNPAYVCVFLFSYFSSETKKLSNRILVLFYLCLCTSCQRSSFISFPLSFLWLTLYVRICACVHLFPGFSSTFFLFVDHKQRISIKKVLGKDIRVFVFLGNRSRFSSRALFSTILPEQERETDTSHVHTRFADILFSHLTSSCKKTDRTQPT